MIFFPSTSHLVWKGIKEMHSLKHTMQKTKTNAYFVKFSQQLFKLQTILEKEQNLHQNRVVVFFLLYISYNEQWHICWTRSFPPGLLLQLCSLFWKLCEEIGIYKSKEITVHVAVKTFRSLKEDVRKSVQRVWVTLSESVCGCLIWQYVSEMTHSDTRHSAKKFQIINFMNI